MIIYPPIIGMTIPGYTTSKVKIPFKHNDAVAKSAVTKFACQIKNYNSSTVLQTITTDANSAIFDNGEIEFSISNLEPNSYYKFQIAYMDSDSTIDLKYSTVAIGKCIGDSDVSIEVKSNNTTWSTNAINTLGRTVEITYTAPAAAEPLYSYQIKLFDKNNNLQLLEDTGEILYNHDNTIGTNSKFYYNRRYYNETYDSDKQYILQITTTTVNGYIQINSYTAQEADLIESIAGYDISLSQNKDNGYVTIQLERGNYDKADENRGLIIERSADGLYWDTIKKLHISKDANLTDCFYKDNSVTQGIEYAYRICEFGATNQESNTGSIYSKPTEPKYITPQFEDIFLSDSERQLKIRFNPKVSSFKDTILEQKQDTIGGKYPFFFRNGQVKYKEIPISGLISYFMDDEEMFISLEDIGLVKDDKTINLTNDNFAAERKFKLEVMDWLNNGKFKLFRSPSEGTYVVRLMNVSLSPNEQLGRMLHTFSATGYECLDSSDYDSLQKNNVINPFTNIILPTENLVFNTILGQKGPATINAGKGNKFTQIVWENINPSYQVELKLDNKTYYNSGKVLNIEGAFDEIIFEEQDGMEFSVIQYVEISNFETNEEFNKAIYYKQYITSFSCNSDETEIVYDDADKYMYHIYQLAITGNSNNSNCYINDTEYSISIGQTIYLSNLNQVSKISGTNVEIVACYLGEAVQ